jgi:hypothetical protein
VAGDAVDEQMVDGAVECLGNEDDGVEGRCDLPGLVAADALGVSAGLVFEFGLGTACFLGQLLDSLAECHKRGLPMRRSSV